MAVKPAMSHRYWVTLILLISSVTVIESKKQFRFVSVVFRHGNRAPDPKPELYPNDPHLDDPFDPMGPGGLTNTGKRKMYNLGHNLRNRYNDFLGNVHIPGDVEARSSNVPRTKTSLQLVLAGLYPPKGIQIWNKKLNWQPIETKYVPRNADNIFFAPYSCPKYFEELMRVVKSSPEVNKLVEEFHPFLQELTNKTGKPMKTVIDMWNLYHGLMAEKSMHLKLPKWTSTFFPKGPLLDAAKLTYRIFSWNNLLKRLGGGVLLKRIIDDMKAVAKNGTSTEARKINLFSGHEYNVAALLSTLGLFKPHVPQYSSAVIIELIRYQNVHYVQIIRYLGIPAKFKVQKIPNCHKLCPLNKFIKLMRPVTPLDVAEECKSDKISPSQLAMMIKQFV